MKGSLVALDRETHLLVAAGSAVAAGCIPCLETIVGMARADGIDEKKIKEAVMTGQYVKDQPADKMKEAADRLVGTHLRGRELATGDGCPLSGESHEGARPQQMASAAGCDPGRCDGSAPSK